MDIEDGWIDAAELRPGSQYMHLYSDEPITITVMRDRESWEEPFGRPGFFKFWARREDTKAEAWVCFGPTGKVLPFDEWLTRNIPWC